MCVYISVEFAASWTNCFVDSRRGVVNKVLRSDSKRFNEELAAAGKSSQENVVEKWKSLVRERRKVGDCSVHCDSVDSVVLQFGDAMIKLEILAEKAKEDARADIQKRRIERFVIRYLPLRPWGNSSTFHRIWEKLSEEGWHEEIAARKSEYEQELLDIKGVMMIRPLGEKGAHAPHL